MYGKPVRRIGDGYVDNVTPETVKEDILLLLDDIHGFYKAALDRLPVKRMPALAPCLLKAGVCFGFLDPVSNIMLNTIAYSQRLPSTESQEGATRKSIFSKISTDTQDRRIFRIPLPGHMAGGMTIARLSLEGLVSFLLFHFRYLAETEALRYLRLARADLVAAVHLINQDRNKSCSASGIAKIHNRPAFDITSPTSKVALECAAASARHPEPAILVNASLSAVSRLSKVSSLLQVHRLPPRTIRRLELLLRREPKVMDQMAIRRPLNLAGSRLRDGKEEKRDLAGSMVSVAHGKVEIDVTVTYRYTESLKLLLLDKIHLLYLDALSKFPRDSLRKHHHCNLLRAGYCYGLMEPVSNIIFNTIWYLNAFREAAVNSWHPLPKALEKFILSALNMNSTELSTMLTHAVKNCRFEGLAMSVSPKSSPTKSEEQVQQLDKLASSSEFLSENQKMFISEIQKKFKADQNFYVRKVKAALKSYSQKQGVYYELHVICGVNPHAVKGGTADLFKKKGKFEYSHINFWATREGSNSAATDPVLFFAECSNDDEDDKETPPLCVPVFSSWISDVRCFHCEFLGKKIVHPYHESYYGRYEDFVGMARGDHSICNEEIISACDFHADMMCTLKEDWIFFDPNMDAMIARANPIKNLSTEMVKWKNRIF
ncbi:hypothetical protein CFC21_040953 [Triticum aestivum]|uniref:Uncharacterized protein n=2 Tax=Triticum aestivum TaxID=4565 RepID=A0A3B6FNQ4_WHEAT|nr:hypothetical protein CFC21_040953 [Triticum aestivum]